MSAACWEEFLSVYRQVSVSLSLAYITEHRHELSAVSTAACADEHRVIGVCGDVVNLLYRLSREHFSLWMVILTRKELSSVSVYQHMCVAWNWASLNSGRKMETKFLTASAAASGIFLQSAGGRGIDHLPCCVKGTFSGAG